MIRLLAFAAVVSWLAVALSMIVVLDMPGVAFGAEIAPVKSQYDVMRLICPLGLDHSDCVPQTARATEKIGEAALPIECLRWGLVSVKGTVMPSAGEYAKVMCVRR